MSDIDISIYPANSQKNMLNIHLYLLFQNAEKKSYMVQRHQHDHVLTPRLYIRPNYTKKKEKKKKRKPLSTVALM